jgi:hypothetical protein
MLTFAGLASMRTMMQSLKTGIDVHIIIIENRYVQRGSARVHVG